jgi:signal transduction histidine kinase
MRALIDELLTYAQAGSVISEPTSVDLRALVVEERDVLAATFEDAGATVEIGDLPVVNAHAEQLARVIQNLLANAVKFASPGVLPHVVVDAERHGDEWHVRCTDNGVGIPAGEEESVFVPFYRLSSGDVSGVGLGLAICRKVIERHGGRLWVEPAPDGGSRFTFTLPVAS